MIRLGIFGTSGMAREAGDIASEIGYKPIYVARDQCERDAWSLQDDIIDEGEINQYNDIEYVIGIGDNRIRRKIVQNHSGHLRFTNLIHPNATFGKGQRQLVEKRHGIIVCAGVRFTSQIHVGNFCIFNLNATISHDVVIDDYVYVAPGAHIAGNVHIGSGAWIGTGAVINQGKSDGKLYIKENCTIGSGAVVIKNCESNAIYAGVPARRIK